MPSFEKYIKQANDRLDEVFKPYGAVRNDGSAEFKLLIERARAYREATKAVANRVRGTLIDEEKAKLSTSKREFAEVYKAFWERH